MNSKTLIIHNPRAGQKKKIVLKEALKKWSKKALHFDSIYDYVETEYGGHAIELAKKAIQDGYSRVVAAGGDGTVNEIASTLIHTNVTLAILPMGSGNGLARHNKIPMDLEKAFHLIFTGKKTIIDTGVINQKKFFCAAGIGFDALVSEKFAHSKTRGLISYFLISLKEYFKYKSNTYHITLDKKEIKRDAFFITFANANQFGNHAYIAPQAVINDGKLEACILKPFIWYKGFALAQRLFNKTIQKSSLYESFTSEEIVVDTHEKIPFHYDGESCVSSSTTINIGVIPQSLRIIIP